MHVSLINKVLPAPKGSMNISGSIGDILVTATEQGVFTHQSQTKKMPQRLPAYHSGGILSGTIPSSQIYLGLCQGD